MNPLNPLILQIALVPWEPLVFLVMFALYARGLQDATADGGGVAMLGWRHGAQAISASADNVIKQHKDESDEDLIAGIFVRSIARKPTANESAICREFLQSGRSRESVEDLLWTIFMLPEFQLIR